MLVTNVSYGSTVFIALKVVDDEEHYSELSNVVSVYFVEPREEVENEDAGNSTLIIVLATTGFILLLLIVIVIGRRRRRIIECVQRLRMRRPPVPPRNEAAEPFPDAEQPPPGPNFQGRVPIMHLDLLYSQYLQTNNNQANMSAA